MAIFKSTCGVCAAEYSISSGSPPKASKCKTCCALKRLGGGQDGRSANTAVGILNWQLHGSPQENAEGTAPTDQYVQQHVLALSGILTALHTGTPPSLSFQVVSCKTSRETLTVARKIRDFLEELEDRCDEVIDALAEFDPLQSPSDRHQLKK